MGRQEVGIVAPISVITMIHNRDGARLRRMIHSLRCQTIQPHEIIIIDTSLDMSDSIKKSLGEPYTGFPYLRYISIPRYTFNKSFALNIGIQKSRREYVLVTDADFMFGSKLIERVMDELRGAYAFTMVLAEAGYLPDIDIDSLDWSKLCKRIRPPARKMSPGTIQAVPRNWIVKVRGYDEEFDGGLGGMDDDMRIRAHKDGLQLVWLSFSEVQCIHQWHEVSNMKGKCSHLFSVDPPVVKNEDGWGNEP